MQQATSGISAATYKLMEPHKNTKDHQQSRFSGDQEHSAMLPGPTLCLAVDLFVSDEDFFRFLHFLILTAFDTHPSLQCDQTWRNFATSATL